METAAWALFLATVGLVGATLVLARHTKTLAGLSAQLVRIENTRDRRSELGATLNLARKIRTIPAENLGVGFAAGQKEDQEKADWFRKLENSSNLIKDADTAQILKSIVRVMDDAQSLENLIGDKRGDLTRHIKILHERLKPSVNDWREVLG